MTQKIGEKRSQSFDLGHFFYFYLGRAFCNSFMSPICACFHHCHRPDHNSKNASLNITKLTTYSYFGGELFQVSIKNIFGNIKKKKTACDEFGKITIYRVVFWDASGSKDENREESSSRRRDYNR